MYIFILNILILFYKKKKVGLAEVNNTLVAIGGFDGTTYLKTVEVYDPDQQIWKLNGSMIYRRLGGGVGVVKIDKDSILFNKSPTALKNSNSKLILFLIFLYYLNSINK